MIRLLNFINFSHLWLSETNVNFSSPKMICCKLGVEENICKFIKVHKLWLSWHIISSRVHFVKFFHQRHISLEHPITLFIPQFSSSPNMRVESLHKLYKFIINEQWYSLRHRLWSFWSVEFINCQSWNDFH